MSAGEPALIERRYSKNLYTNSIIHICLRLDIAKLSRICIIFWKLVC